MRVLFDIPSPLDATSFYRGIVPIAELGRKRSDLYFYNDGQWSWASLAPADIVFMQRPFNDTHHDKAIMAKKWGKPLWVDLDDWLLDVPTDNPAHSTYNTDNIKQNIVKILEMADILTVSTNHLKKLYSPFHKDIRVVHNCLYDAKFKLQEKRPKRNKLVMWRGSRTHHKDVMSVTPQLANIAKDEALKEWVFEFVGDNLWFATDIMPHERTFWGAGMDIYEYHKHIKDVAPSVMIVPLFDSDFNKSKSNIAWLEATYAGAMTLAPDFEEWRRPGIVNYKDPADFEKKLRLIMHGEINVEAQVEQSLKDVNDHYLLSEVNIARQLVLDDLYKR